MAQGRFSRWNPGEDMGMSDPTWGGGKLGSTATNSIMNVVRDTAPKLSEVRKGYVDTFNNLISPGTRDLRKDIRSLGPAYSDWYTNKYPEGMSDLAKDIITEITNIAATPADTALALASGMATSVAAPYAALPTLLRSDDPLTREGSKEWVDKMHSVAEKIPTYEARTPVGQAVTEFVGSAWEVWNNQVAARMGVGIENALKFVGVDYKVAERAGALTAGVVGAAPAVAPALRVRGESTSLPVRGADRTSIQNSRINALANIADPNVMARIWMQADPVGFARAKADGTLNKKLSDMGWEFTDHIESMPVLKEQLGTWKQNEASGKWEYHSDRLGEFRHAGRPETESLSPSGKLIVKEEIALDPTALDLYPMETGTAGHEMHHAFDRHAYKELRPESEQTYSQWRDQQVAAGRIGRERGTHSEGAFIDEYHQLEGYKQPWGYLSEEIPSVKKLSDAILDQQTQNTVSTRQALPPEGGGLIDWGEPHGGYPPHPGGMNPSYWSFEAWVQGIRDELSVTASPLEISARLDGLQRFLKTNDLGVSDIFTKHEYLGPGNWREVKNPKLEKAPNDVNQLIEYLNDLVADKYGELQRSDVERLPPIDVERVGKYAGQTTPSNLNKLKALHVGRIGAATKYAMDMLTEAIADTKITFPKKYKIGFAK